MFVKVLNTVLTETNVFTMVGQYIGKWGQWRWMQLINVVLP